MTSRLIDARHFSVRLGGSSVLNRVNLTIAPSESVGLIGESGSGKSMFAKAILGFLPRGSQMEGELDFAGESIANRTEDQMCVLRGDRIGYVPQDPAASFNPTLRVADQISESMIYHRDSASHSRSLGAVEMLRRVGLTEPERRVRQFPHEMSGGMLQRALIAAAVNLGPDLLIADEPTTGLDVTTQAEIMSLLHSIQQETGMAMLLISHDLALVSMMCTRIVVLYRGDVVETGASADILGAPQHPYTRALLSATPTLAARDMR